MRVLVINLTSPEARGASIALLGSAQRHADQVMSPHRHPVWLAGFVNCIGRGFGPLLLELYMSVLSIDRREALQSLLNLWLLSGALICLAARSLDKDEERVRATLRRIADNIVRSDEAAGWIGGLDMEATGASTSTSASSSSMAVLPINFRTVQPQPPSGLTPLFAASAAIEKGRSSKLPGYLL